MKTSISPPFFIWILLACISYIPSLQAGHIVGGEMTYVCLGNGNYRVRLDLYIDCNCVNCAQFDNVASFGIYSCGGSSNIDCARLNQINRIQVVNTQVKNIIQVPNPNLECVIDPPNPCVSRGTYEFEVNLFSQDNASFFVTYQRCCRNITINNLVEPEDVGATFFVEITPEAQMKCNRSAQFKVFPPTVICADSAFEFDHSAIDMDGDSIAYRFCAPLQGGGKDGGPDRPGQDPRSCSGIIPSPGCPPPYEDVLFKAPYSFLNPMGGSPEISIHPLTGMISGRPNIIGQFAVGVCADEYRNGLLINTIHREFQFNTARCEKVAMINIEADSVIDGNKVYLKSCGSTTIDIINRGRDSYLGETIEYLWEFEEAVPAVSMTKNVTLTFPDTGLYRGILIVNPGGICMDTAEIFVNIFPGIESDFDVSYDTCIAGEVQFTDLSSTEAIVLTSWTWDFGDGNGSTLQHPMHNYRISGDFEVLLTTKDNNGCEASKTIIIPYYPAPDVISVSLDREKFCQFAEVHFYNLSEPINDTYEFNWDFGDGNIGMGQSPVHVYETVGIYSINLMITSPNGCESSQAFPELIHVLTSPTAAFDYTPKDLSNFNRNVSFIDKSINAIDWLWDFGSLEGSAIPNPSFVFPDTGQFFVRLIVTDENGCQDSTLQILDILPKVRYFLPNAFTPNDDQLNDEFKGVGSTKFMSDFRMSIWTRQGELAFETNDPQEGWNGRKFNTGEMYPRGVYVVLVSYVDPRGERIEMNGIATLIR
jgi:gliding motility-associated-like protein